MTIVAELKTIDSDIQRRFKAMDSMITFLKVNFYGQCGLLALSFFYNWMGFVAVGISVIIVGIMPCFWYHRWQISKGLKRMDQLLLKAQHKTLE